MQNYVTDIFLALWETFWLLAVVSKGAFLALWEKFGLLAVFIKGALWPLFITVLRVLLDASFSKKVSLNNLLL